MGSFFSKPVVVDGTGQSFPPELQGLLIQDPKTHQKLEQLVRASHVTYRLFSHGKVSLLAADMTAAYYLGAHPHVLTKLFDSAAMVLEPREEDLELNITDLNRADYLGNATKQLAFLDYYMDIIEDQKYEWQTLVPELFGPQSDIFAGLFANNCAGLRFLACAAEVDSEYLFGQALTMSSIFYDKLAGHGVSLANKARKASSGDLLELLSNNAALLQNCKPAAADMDFQTFTNSLSEESWNTISTVLLADITSLDSALQQLLYIAGLIAAQSGSYELLISTQAAAETILPCNGNAPLFSNPQCKDVLRNLWLQFVLVYIYQGCPPLNTRAQPGSKTWKEAMAYVFSESLTYKHSQDRINLRALLFAASVDSAHETLYLALTETEDDADSV